MRRAHLRPWGADLATLHQGRGDEAYLALLMLSITGFHGLTMTPNWGRLTGWLSESLSWGNLIAFTRFLAPPEKKPFNVAAKRGEAHFAQLGCVKCHIPSLPSSRGPVEAYTDLLLHDMGPALAGS